MNRTLSDAATAATANIDQEWAGMRDVVFEMRLGGVEGLTDHLLAPDAADWLRNQPDSKVRMIAAFADLAICRMSLELIDDEIESGRLDE